MMNKHLFEIQTKHNLLYTFNIHHVNFLKFHDDKCSIAVHIFASYNSYTISSEKYQDLKNTVLDLIKKLELKYIISNETYMFREHLSGLLMSPQGYLVTFKTVRGFYPIEKHIYYELLETI